MMNLKKEVMFHKDAFNAFSPAYCFTLIYNFLTAMAMLIVDADPIHAGETFGISILYLIANVPLSYLCWYRPAYNALK